MSQPSTPKPKSMTVTVQSDKAVTIGQQSLKIKQEQSKKKEGVK